MIAISMDVQQYDCPFIDTTDDYDLSFSAVQWDFHHVDRELETRLIVEASSRGALDDGLDRLQHHDNLHQVDLLSKRGEVAHIRTRIGQTNAMKVIRQNGGYITGPFHIEAGSETWHVGFDNDGVADGALSELDQNNDFTVESRDQVEIPMLGDFIQNVGAAMTLIEGCRDLSDVERRTLEEAANSGYFETPRETTLGALADEFDVSKPAVSKNLRRAEQKLLRRAIDAMDRVD